MQKYEPPEGVHGGKLKKRTEKWSADVWGLGCLIWEIFNGPLPKSSSLKSVGKIPGNLLSHYGEVVSATPKTRPDPAKFIAQCRGKGQYLANSFVDSNLFLAEIQVWDASGCHLWANMRGCLLAPTAGTDDRRRVTDQTSGMKSPLQATMSLKISDDILWRNRFLFCFRSGRKRNRKNFLNR